jgi:hypothetical protein
MPWGEHNATSDSNPKLPRKVLIAHQLPRAMHLPTCKSCSAEDHTNKKSSKENELLKQHVHLFKNCDPKLQKS